MENVHNGENEGKLSTYQVITVQHEKIGDPFFLY